MCNWDPPPWQGECAFSGCCGTVGGGHGHLQVVLDTVRRIGGRKRHGSVGCVHPDVFEDFTAKEEFLILLPLKTTRGVDVYNSVKNYFIDKGVQIEKLVSITTDGAPAMRGFIANCKSDPDFPRFLSYHCVIHQEALCAKVMDFNHVMTPVIKNNQLYSSEGKTTQELQTFS